MKEKDKDFIDAKCSVCGKIITLDKKDNYVECPHCGEILEVKK